jgi:multiple sugar transport system substrate-binding protein
MKAFRDLFSYAVPILLLVAIFLSGCTAPSIAPISTPTAAAVVPTASQPPATQPPAATPETACSNTVKLKMDDWSNTDEARAARDEVMASFHAAYPCIEVEATNLEAMDPERLERIKAGTASDLVAADSSYIPAYMEAGGLSDLMPFLQSDPDFKPEEIYFQGVWKSGFYQGTPRAINKDFSTSAVYVNVGLFKKAGLSLPKEGWTYDDYLRLAQQLTLDDQGRNAADPGFDAGHIVQYGTTVPFWGGNATAGWFRGFQNILYSFDAHALSPDGTKVSGYLNGPKSLTAWTFARDLVHKYHVAPDTAVINAQSDGNVSLLKAGQLAMVGHFWGPWFQETLDATPGLEWAVVPLPSGPAGHKGVIMWMGWGINPKTAHPQEAWELLKWLTTEPGQRPFTRRALTQYKPLAVELQRINDPFWGPFLAETEYVDRLDDATHARFVPCVADGPTANLMYEIWQPGGEQIDLQARLDQLAAEADKCLAGAE